MRRARCAISKDIRRSCCRWSGSSVGTSSTPPMSAARIATSLRDWVSGIAGLQRRKCDQPAQSLGEEGGTDWRVCQPAEAYYRRCRQVNPGELERTENSATTYGPWNSHRLILVWCAARVRISHEGCVRGYARFPSAIRGQAELPGIVHRG